MGKTRRMAAGRKLKLHMIRQRLSHLDKQRFLEKHLGNEWNKPYGPGRTDEAKQLKTPVFFADDWWKNVEEIGPVMRDIPGLRYKLIKYKGVWVKALIMGKI